MKNNQKNTNPTQKNKPTTKRPRKPKDNISSKSPISQATFKLGAQFDNSLTPQQGVSQLSNNPDQLLTNPTINLQANPLYKYHKQNLNLKHKIVKTLAFCFYNVEEYAMINYICYVLQQKFKNQIGHTIVTSDKYKDHQWRVQLDIQQTLTIKKDELLQKFSQGQKIIQALAQSRMIMDKQSDAGMLKINNRFFNMLTSICDDLIKKVAETQKQINEVEKVTCKGCLMKRPYYQIQAKMKCGSCGSMEILKANNTHQNHLLQSIKTLKQQINRVLQWRSDIQQLRKKQIQRLTLQRKKNQQNQRVTDADLDASWAAEYVQKQKMNVPTFVSLWQKDPIKINGVHIRLFQKQHAPKRQYLRIKQLQEVSATRKRRKIEKSVYIL